MRTSAVTCTSPSISGYVAVTIPLAHTPLGSFLSATNTTYPPSSFRTLSCHLVRLINVVFTDLTNRSQHPPMCGLVVIAPRIASWSRSAMFLDSSLSAPLKFVPLLENISFGARRLIQCLSAMLQLSVVKVGCNF